MFAVTGWLIFQDFHLLDNLSAVDNVTSLELSGVASDEAVAAAEDALQKVGLGDRLNLPRPVSGGQQQRVAIARAIAGNRRHPCR